jgi:hypothetical protein
LTEANFFSGAFSWVLRAAEAAMDMRNRANPRTEIVFFKLTSLKNK